MEDKSTDFIYDNLYLFGGKHLEGSSNKKKRMPHKRLSTKDKFNQKRLVTPA